MKVLNVWVSAGEPLHCVCTVSILLHFILLHYSFIYSEHVLC